MNNHEYIDESRLNPTPKSYRVSLATKSGFLLLALFGVAGYFYILTKKRSAEEAFLVEQHIDAKEPSLNRLPEMNILDVVSKTQTPLSSLQGSWLLLNIWATWCPSCQSEMPSLDLLQDKLRGSLAVVAVSIDEKLDEILQYKSVHQPGFRLFWDQEKTLPQWFNLKKYPETFLVAPDGRLIKQFSGPREWSSSAMVAYLLNAIRINPPSAPN